MGEVHGVGGGARSIWSKDRRSRSIRAPLSADKSPFRGAIVEGITQRGKGKGRRGARARNPSSDFGFSIGRGTC